jgi:hypothetical protein
MREMPYEEWCQRVCTCSPSALSVGIECAYCEQQDRDSDGTATAAANGDLPVPEDCQARAESIAHKPSPTEGFPHG